MKTLFIFFTVCILILSSELYAQPKEAKQNKFLVTCKLMSPRRTIKGQLFSYTDSSLLIIKTKSYIENTEYTKYNYYKPSFDRIRVIKFRKKHAVALGTLTGLISGTGIGLLLGFSATSKDDPNTQYEDESAYRGVGIAAVTIFGAIIGTSIGAMIGSVQRTFYINGHKDYFIAARQNFNKYSIKKIK